MKALFIFLFYWIVISGNAQIPVLTLASLSQHAEQENNEAPPVKRMLGTGMIVRLHPSLGNAITQQTKKEFGLFPEMPDSTFGMAQLVKYDDSTYTFIFHSAKDVRIERSITVSQLLDMYMTVERIKPAPPAPPMPQVVLVATKEKKHTAPNPNKNEVSVLDAIVNVLTIIDAVANNSRHHTVINNNYERVYKP